MNVVREPTHSDHGTHPPYGGWSALLRAHQSRWFISSRIMFQHTSGHLAQPSGQRKLAVTQVILNLPQKVQF